MMNIMLDERQKEQTALIYSFVESHNDMGAFGGDDDDVLAMGRSYLISEDSAFRLCW